MNRQMENNILKDRIAAISAFREELKALSLDFGDELEEIQSYYDLLTSTPKPGESAQYKEREEYIKYLKEQGISIDTAKECLEWQIVAQKVVLPFSKCFIFALKNVRYMREYQEEIVNIEQGCLQAADIVADGTDVELVKEAIEDIIWQEIGCPDYALDSIDNRIDQALSDVQDITKETDPIIIAKQSSCIPLSQMVTDYYKNKYNQFDSYVNNILEGILENEYIHDLVQKIKDENLIKLPQPADAPFTLPDNYFELPSGIESEFIGSVNTNYRVPGAIANMINYFASEGLIDDNILVKQNFAYRLTGKMKPDCIIEKITWNGEHTYKLFIMCRHLYGGRYDEMKHFIDAKNDAGFSKRSSSYAAETKDRKFYSLMKEWFGR